jgi:feruloyl esterase
MKRLTWLGFVLVLMVSETWGQEAQVNTPSCASLAKLTLPNTKITLAEQVEAGAFPPPAEAGSTPEAQIYQHLPAFCRVVAEVAPTADSDIKMEVWMPVTGWNGKFRGQGNGGFAGVIDYTALALAVKQGYASGGTDTGHAGSSTDASWALGHPEKVIDFGYRGVHEMTQKSKSIVEAYYRNAPTHSYFASCSDGGREALMEAQRFPGDYDGILAGAPAYDWTHLLTNAAHNAQVLLLDPASYIPASKLPAIDAAVVAACDKSDGVSDDILNDPRQCRFDPAALLCKDAETDKCLTGAQVTALKELYAGAHDSAGKLVFPGYLPGSEAGPGGWAPWITGLAPGKSLMFAFGTGYFSNMVYAKPDWDYKTFKVDDGLKLATEKTAQALNATDPNLKPFGKRGGKLILYHGWNDPAISALSTVDYYKNVMHATGERNAESFVRLYMVPGVQHCSGGPGPDTFGQFGWRPGMETDDPQHDMYTALEQWVEKGTAPEKLIAVKYAGEGAARRETMTRPLCAYPKVAKYKGTGETSDAANFVCVAGSK